jgi:FkbM family methyltransferase
VASRRELLAAHAHLAAAAARADGDDYRPKRTTVLGMPVSFFSWSTLHYLFDEIFVTSGYEFEPAGEPLRIIDAGANIGMATLWFARAYPSARITAIEPDPTTFGLLRTNLEDNGFDQVTPVQAALASKPGSIEFVVDPDRPGWLMMSVDARRMHGTPVTVPAMRLSDLVDGPVDFLKLDVEGAEHEVMGELADSGALTSIRAMVMEYHHHIDPGVDRLADMLRLLEEHDFAYRVSAPPVDEAVSSRSVSAFQDVMVAAVRRSA